MFAVLAFVSFLVALILHIVHAGKYVLDFELTGWALLAAHLAWGIGWPWTRARP
jgi:hypothetical protein